jgi:hypothetical protein
MRFEDGGPDIPDALIEERDRGGVVFFCGAGLSRPVGLPDFEGLTRALLDKLGAQESRHVWASGESFDRVFSALIKEFGGASVDQEIALALRAPRKPNLRFHQIALDLSRDAAGAAQIVTTNFDLLFERADRRVRTYVPPALPDLALLQPIQGVVYLHGRLTKSAESARAGYVISSADFGRAYLAEGWAARFVRELRDRYTIVLLGYSANDPPMRYLLEGLNSREGSPFRSPLYAFVAGEPNAVDEQWQDKGVTTISYDPMDADHSGLWSSLEAWACVARDPQGWHDRVVALAQQSPLALRPFQRGQVANLVKTKTGARAFASAVPPPPAEWLCVFDSYTRYGKPGRISWTDDREIDPLELYGLDSDPERQPPNPTRDIEPSGEDLIRWRRGDESWPERIRLSGWHGEWTSPLPPRLYQLARWFSKIMDQPAAIWWAAGNPSHHPGLISEIKRALDRQDVSKTVEHFWFAYLEGASSRVRSSPNDRWFNFADRVKRTGWTASALRHFERVTTPFFEISRPSLRMPCPPSGTWEELPLHHVADINVRVVAWDDSDFEVAPDVLLDVIRILRRSLNRMSEMLAESTVLFWRTPTLHPTGERGENSYHGRKVAYFLQFKTLFRSLIERDHAAACTEFESWNNHDRYFFAKLILFVVSLPKVVPPALAVDRIIGMPDEVFWDADHHRELLFALRDRWSDFTARDRRRIERRLTAGPPRYDRESRAKYTRRRKATAASMLRWLELQGRKLSPRTSAKLPKLGAADERWDDSWAWNAADTHGPWGGAIHRVTETQGLEAADLRHIISLAEKLSTDDIRQLRDYRPFDGLVEKAPFRALAALRLEGRADQYPIRFWKSLLSHWPAGVDVRLNLLLGHTLSRLPAEAFQDLRHHIPDWIRQFVPAIATAHRNHALAIFDNIAARFLAADPEVVESGVGFSTIDGVAQESSHVSVTKSINAAGGKLAETLFALFEAKKGHSFPSWATDRIETLFKLPGHGAGHAANVVSMRLSWIEYWDRRWAERLLPFFDLSHPLSEAAWHGIAHDRHLLTSSSQHTIKHWFLSLLKGEADWQLDKQPRKEFLRRLVWLCKYSKAPPITFTEARSVLVQADDDGRAAALSALATAMREDGQWARLVRPFILNAWPRQLRFQSEATSRYFAQIAELAGDDFPEAVATILPYLHPVAHLDTFGYRLRKGDQDGRDYTRRFPESTLTLLATLIGNDPQRAPWELGQLLDAIVEARPVLRQSDHWRRLKRLTE